jgi:hypothetical protein
MWKVMHGVMETGTPFIWLEDDEATDDLWGHWEPDGDDAKDWLIQAEVEIKRRCSVQAANAVLDERIRQDKRAWAKCSDDEIVKFGKQIQRYTAPSKTAWHKMTERHGGALKSEIRLIFTRAMTWLGMDEPTYKEARDKTLRFIDSSEFITKLHLDDIVENHKTYLERGSVAIDNIMYSARTHKTVLDESFQQERRHAELSK